MNKSLRLAAILAVAHGAPAFGAETAQFISRVYFVIHESSPQQIQRGRRAIEREFAETVSGVPSLQPYRYQVVSDGNQIIFSMVTQADTRTPFQEAVSDMVGQLNGRIRTRGRYDFMRTPDLQAPSQNFLEVTLDESNTKIKSISARAVTLRDFLAELKLQFGEPEGGIRPVAMRRPSPSQRFSYMIPGDCASKEFDWNSTEGAPAKTVEETMTEVAKLLNLRVENHNGTFIFSGDCPRSAKDRRISAMEFLPARWIPLDEVGQTQPPVHPQAVPLIPISALE